MISWKNWLVMCYCRLRLLSILFIPRRMENNVKDTTNQDMWKIKWNQANDHFWVQSHLPKLPFQKFFILCKDLWLWLEPLMQSSRCWENLTQSWNTYIRHWNDLKQSVLPKDGLGCMQMFNFEHIQKSHWSRDETCSDPRCPSHWICSRARHYPTFLLSDKIIVLFDPFQWKDKLLIQNIRQTV